MKLLYIPILSLIFLSCCHNSDCENHDLNQAYLNNFFCRNMNLLKLNTYKMDVNREENLEIRALIEEIVSDSNNLKALNVHCKNVSSILDSLILKKAYLLKHYEIFNEIDHSKREMNSRIIGQVYNGIVMATEIIVTFSYIDFCGFGNDKLGLFITDTICLEANRCYEFDYDVRPHNSTLVYYNTYAQNEAVNKTKISLDTRNKSNDVFVQEIEASVTNSITQETKTYRTPIVVKLSHKNRID